MLGTKFSEMLLILSLPLNSDEVKQEDL